MVVQPDQTLGYWLARAARHAATAYADALRACCARQGKPYAITPPQYNVLALLWESDGLTAGAIGERRHLDPPTITSVVTRLENIGLVERVHGRNDRRVVHVHLTEDGRRMTPLLSDALVAFMERLERDIPMQAMESARTALRQIVTSLSGDEDGEDDHRPLHPLASATVGDESTPNRGVGAAARPAPR